MLLNLAMSAMSVVEFVLWAALAFLFWKKGLHRRFPATTAYLTLRTVFTVLLLAILRAAALPWGGSHHFNTLYFYGYFTMYVASAVLLYFICIEVFRSALTAFPAILKIAIVVFRWAAAVAVIVSLTSLPHANNIPSMISNISYYGLMRSVSVLELCLLAFLGLSMNALRLSVRDMAFGIALSFGVMSAGDFIASFWSFHITSVNGPVQVVGESLLLLALGIWLVYCFLPKPVSKPMLMPASSAIYRWNEIASALGHTGTKVAVQQPSSNNFFLSDVERVVEKVLARNMSGQESET
jgi:hypothetical protein